MSIWTLGWLLWGALFVFIEYPAVKRKVKGDDMDTLSEQVWWVRDKIPGAKILIPAFLLWLSLHFMFGG